MDTAEYIKALTPGAAVLVIFLTALRLWLRDRNKRISDKDQYISDLKEALAKREAASDKDREIARLALEGARTLDQLFEVLRKMANQSPTDHGGG